MQTETYVLQFRIELLGVEPPIWRRIQVPLDYTFWDLHVAIQDAMGWLDYHLHAFRLVGSESEIGIPFDEALQTLPGWELAVRERFSEYRPLATYEYDFGDSWIHEIRFEGYKPTEAGMGYLRCVDGARRCPPEDCGGVYGYEDFLRVIADPTEPEHESMLQWVGGSFDPEAFDPARVRFDDPAERWATAFSEPEC